MCNTPSEELYMKKIIAPILSLIILALAFCGCQDQNQPESLLDPNDPVTLTIWHVYGEQADSPMNLLIEEFNRTVGHEKGILIHVSNVTSTSKLFPQLQDALEENPGAMDVPDMFSCHTQNAVSLGTQMLVNWDGLFSADELAAYVPKFLESGTIDGELTVFPVSKSTYALFINGSQFERFSADTGVMYDDLADWDGFFDAAEKYYEWSGGKPFCAFDYLIRHMELDILARCGELSYTESGWFDENDEAVRSSFTMFAEPLAKGHITVSDLYANTQVMTGEVLAGIGSSAAIVYYNDIVTYPDNTSEPMDLHVLPLPHSNVGTEYMPQTGVGLCAIRTTDKKAEAAAVFIKWFTEPERNLTFVSDTGYMPVTNGAFDAIESHTFTDEGYSALYSAIKVMHDSRTPIVRPDFEGFYEKTEALYSGLRAMQPSLAERAKAGEDINKLTGELWEFFCAID